MAIDIGLFKDAGSVEESSAAQNTTNCDMGQRRIRVK